MKTRHLMIDWIRGIKGLPDPELIVWMIHKESKWPWWGCWHETDSYRYVLSLSREEGIRFVRQV